MGSVGRESVGFDGEMFYLGLALAPAYVKVSMEGCPERIVKDYPEDENLLCELW
jgi:hypothetical protein